MPHKAALGAVEVVPAATGAPEVDAAGYVIATLGTYGVVDADGDVLVRGCFDGTGVFAISTYNHGSWGQGIGALPVGLGAIREGDRPMLAAKFFDTFSGREAFATVRQLGPVGQWSWGYDVLDSEPGVLDGRRVRMLRGVKVHEASPVLLGASVNAATVSTHEIAGASAADMEMAREFLRFVAAQNGLGVAR